MSRRQPAWHRARGSVQPLSGRIRQWCSCVGLPLRRMPGMNPSLKLKGLVRRIETMQTALQILAMARPYSGGEHFYPAMQSIFESPMQIVAGMLDAMSDQFPELPGLTSNEIVSLSNEAKKPKNWDFGYIATMVAKLVALRAELILHLEFPSLATGLTERAFAHLQRLIVADPEVNDKWQAAFLKGEPACEGLGGAHLLMHGIWAFKAYSKGERTDLVLGESLKVTEEMRSAATALVLTEWKLVREDQELETKMQQAKEQTKIYSDSSLAGFELETVRYLVMVSRKRMKIENETVDEGGIRYRYINIAVAPLAPAEEASRLAREAARKKDAPG
jgi:hypothetical protein